MSSSTRACSKIHWLNRSRVDPLCMIWWRAPLMITWSWSTKSNIVSRMRWTRFWWLISSPAIFNRRYYSVRKYLVLLIVEQIWRLGIRVGPKEQPNNWVGVEESDDRIVRLTLQGATIQIGVTRQEALRGTWSGCCDPQGMIFVRHVGPSNQRQPNQVLEWTAFQDEGWLGQGVDQK